MKPLFFSFIFLLTITVSQATPNLNLSSNGQHLVLNTSEWNRSTHTVKILDQEGQILYSKEFAITDAATLKKFNVSKLSAGIYKVEVDDFQYTSRQGFTIADGAIKLNANIETVIKPVIKLSGKILKVNFLNLNHHTIIKLLDPVNNVLYEGTFDTPAYTKQFNLSSLEKGIYTVVIAQEKERFVNNIEL